MKVQALHIFLLSFFFLANKLRVVEGLLFSEFYLATVIFEFFSRLI